MPTNQELNAKVDELQIALDAEQQQVADLLAAKEADITAKQAVIDQLQTVVADLEAQVAAGGTEAERQAILDKLNAALTDLQATVADAPPVEPPTEG